MTPTQTYSRSIVPSIICDKLIPPMDSVIFAGSFSLPLSLPAEMAARTAFSISRWEVIPTFFRKFRRLVLNVSSFIVGLLVALAGAFRCRYHHIGGLRPAAELWDSQARDSTLSPARRERIMPPCPADTSQA